MQVKETPGFIEFKLPIRDVEAMIKRNKYEHCDFQRLEIVGYYTSVNYEGGS